MSKRKPLKTKNKAVIEYLNEDGSKESYSFDVIVSYGKIDGIGNGKYESKIESMRGCPVIRLSPDRDGLTICHECLHATIDFFRTIGDGDFNEMLNSSIINEEAFVIMHSEFVRATYVALGMM